LKRRFFGDRSQRERERENQRYPRIKSSVGVEVRCRENNKNQSTPYYQKYYMIRSQLLSSTLYNRIEYYSIENFVATTTTTTSTMMILLKSGVILGMKNKPITATTTATIATVTATPPTSKIAVEEFYDEDIVEYEDEERY